MNPFFIFGIAMLILYFLMPKGGGRRSSGHTYNIKCVRKRKINGKWVEIGRYSVSGDTPEEAIEASRRNLEILQEMSQIEQDED